ncbi:FaeA/PapI family transcriptional regulator [Erwinia tasmaniensis]|uniref:FaeA/PapI family transcriptional regulator n=1 Tax=Erwinia tasmaniensis TaxID=338565 RepID=UPI0008FF9DC7|nr:FaeA/PapI family transcriptional regulator [Erwinia tasmaniensis]
MKFSRCCYGSGALHKNHTNSLDNLLALAAGMGISNFATVNAPEQISILELLREHRPEGLSTRDLANMCGISIYKVRHLLLPLERYGRVSRDKMQKHHRWFLSKEPTGM